MNKKIDNLASELEEYLGKELGCICIELNLQGKASDDISPLLHSWIFEKNKMSDDDLFVICYLLKRRIKKEIYYLVDAENNKVMFYDTYKYTRDGKSQKLIEFHPYH